MSMAFQKLCAPVFVFRLKPGEGVVHFFSRARMYPWPPMKDPIHCCFAARAQLGNFIK
jgi:hypothetical protein